MWQWIQKVTIVLIILGTSNADNLLVNTPSGPIRGTTTKSATGKDVDVFYGIPYAEPPVGNNRFGPPVELKSWHDELDGTKPSPACYQQEFLYNPEEALDDAAEWLPQKPYTEDCLKLHIWVPKPRPTKSAVMVYIHGGSFVLGYPLAEFLSGVILAAEENVIVVSMSYRLSVQGFLYLGIPEAPGNMGLMDQQMALKWIRKNIASFGGNPDDVTIFGMSAGSASVGYQLLSPGSRGLFKRAILMSGTPNTPWAIQTKEDIRHYSKKLAKSFGCESGNPQEVLHCVQSIEPESLCSWNKHNFELGIVDFGPTVDGTFISDYPENLLNQKDETHPDVMVGSTFGEGSIFMSGYVPDINQSPDGKVTEEEFISALNSTLKKYHNLVREVIPLLFTDWTRTEDPLMWRDALKDFLSHYHFDCPANSFADHFLRKGTTVYRYAVDHHLERFPFPKWMGTPHGADSVLHMGSAAGGGPRATQDDVILSKRVMRWFANFARTGNPNEVGESGPTWDEMTLAGKEYFLIAVNPVMEKHFFTQECAVLNKMMEIIDDHLRHRTKCSSTEHPSTVMKDEL